MYIIIIWAWTETIFSLVPLFWKNTSLLMKSLFCLCVCVSVYPPINLWIPKPAFMKFDIYIMVLETISTSYFLNPPHQSVCLHVNPHVSLLGNGSVYRFPWQRIHATIEELLEASFSILPRISSIKFNCSPVAMKSMSTRFKYVFHLPGIFFASCLVLYKSEIILYLRDIE
jgi:hypothetical protein